MTEQGRLRRQRQIEQFRQRGLARRWRCTEETELLKQYIWYDTYFGPRHSERWLAAKLSVSQSYIHKVRCKQPPGGLTSVLSGGCPTDAELLAAANRTSEQAIAWPHRYQPRVVARIDRDCL